MGEGKRNRPSKAGKPTISPPDLKHEAPARSFEADHEHPLEASFFVVGLGASAGGLETLEQFFANMPPDSGMAFVVVVHLDPTHKTLLPELLARYTRMEVCLADEGMTVEPNRIYVIPANRDLTLDGGQLHLEEPIAPRGMRHTIDVFFRALAADLEENAIGVILSGTGTDGTQGVKAIKESGGIVIVQEPGSAKYPGMPQSAIATGMADLVLPVQEMPVKIREIVQRTMLLISGDGKNPPREISERLRTIFRLVKSATGHDFSSYKTSTVMRRIERRMAVNTVVNIDNYIQLLKDEPREAKALFKEVLIGVTSFFRDPEAFDALRELVLPQMFQHGDVDEPLRIWLSGCATGEEAYSVAILAREFARDHSSNRKVQIFATDLDAEAVEIGRMGLYPDSISADVSAERLRTFFKKQDNNYQVVKPLREMIVFAQHNLIKDPPFSKLDLLICRNLLIYLKPEMQKRLLPLFFQALKPDGHLFLGTSETVGSATDLFLVRDKRWKIFQRRGVVGKVEVSFPLTAQRQPQDDTSRVRNFREEVISPGTLAERILIQRYSPPCVVINEKSEIVYFSTRTSRYLEPPIGEPSQQILKLAKDDLRPPLRAAIHKAYADQQPVHYQGLKIHSEQGEETLDLKVEPISQPASAKGLALVVFEPRQPHSEPAVSPPPATDEELDRELVIHQLEEQLRITHEQLQATIERLETSNEELKSSNEELMSMNEEFQSTNEELETSKEELQALNEELVTVNAELESKVDELAQTSNDLQNLLNSSDIATLFLDRQLQVKRFTPAMAKVFNLINSDLGRPLQHISGKINFPELQRDAREVLETLTPVTREVITADEERTYQLRVLPYRTMEDLIDGVVVTLVDLTDRIEAEAAADRLAAIVESSDDAIFSQSLDGEILSWNHGAKRIYGYSAREMVGQQMTRLLPEDLAEQMNQCLLKVKGGRRCRQLETRHRCKGGQTINISLTVSPIKNHQGQIVGVACIARDISERKTLERQLKHAIAQEQAHSAELKALLEAVPAAVLTSHDSNCQVITGNRAAYNLLRVRPGENTSKSNPEAPVGHFKVLHDGRELVPEEMPIQRAATRGETVLHYEEEIVFDNGDKVMVLGNSVPLKDPEGKVAGAIAAFVDITPRVQAEEELRQARIAADAANRAKSLFLANMSHEIRTPLTGVLGSLDLLAETPLNDEQEKLHKMAARSGRDLLKLISDILDFSKIEAGQLAFVKAPVELGSCVRQAIQVVRFEADKKQLPIHFDGPEDGDLVVQVDCPRLHQVLFNLLGNAIKFTRQGEIRVTVQAQKAADAKGARQQVFRFEVADTGIGIPQESQAEIFASFSQVDDSISRNYGGTGLGLAICKSLVEGMGGELGVHSEPGQGSRFWFTLPMEVVAKERASSAPTVAGEPSSTSDKGSGRRLKVLVAEDEPTLRNLIQLIFQQRDHEVVVVANGQAAIEVWEQGDCDIILMDVQMPGMNGIETVQRIREQERTRKLSRTPVIALTAHALREDLENCMAAGMDGYLAKPIDMQELFALLDEYREC